MIECEICKKYQSEGQFIELRHGGYAICNDCKETPAAIAYREKWDKRADEIYQQEMEYETKRRERIKNQDYEGQYDWM